jgi:hypothetical protein
MRTQNLFNEQTNGLKIAGAFVDRISHIIQVTDPIEFRRKPQRFSDSLKKVNVPNLQLGGAWSPKEALWRTLIANRAPRSKG